MVFKPKEEGNGVFLSPSCSLTFEKLHDMHYPDKVLSGLWTLGSSNSWGPFMWSVTSLDENIQKLWASAFVFPSCRCLCWTGCVGALHGTVMSQSISAVNITKLNLWHSGSCVGPILGRKYLMRSQESTLSGSLTFKRTT